MKLFVLDTHTIYRRGLVACLSLLDEVEAVAEAERVRDAWEHPASFEADLVVVDPSLPGGADFVAGVRETVGARVIVCVSQSGQDAALGALQAGAVGYLRKDELTPETLSSAVRAAADGTGVVAPELLEHLLAKLPENTEAKPAPARLTLASRRVRRARGANLRRPSPPPRPDHPV